MQRQQGSRDAGYERVRARLVRVGLDGHAEGAAEAQVGDLEAVDGVVDKQVLRLEVAVHHAVLVAVRNALDQLVHEALRAQGAHSTREDRMVFSPWPTDQAPFALPGNKLGASAYASSPAPSATQLCQQ